MTPALEVDVTTQEQVTHFRDPVQATMMEKPEPSNVKPWLGNASEETSTEIKNFLARPVPFKSGVLSSSDSGNHAVLGVMPTDVLVFSSALRSKLAYYTYFRADMHFRFVFNSMPFQSGKYWMYFAPFEGECNRPILNTLQNATGYPGVEIDLASGAPVDFFVPYCSPLSHYNIALGEGTMGSLYLCPISPVGSSIAPDTVSYTVYAWFTNVDLHLPTSKTIVTPFEAQVLVGEEISKLADPVVQAGKTAIQSGISTLAQVPLTWMQRAIEGVASSVGLSKPHDTSHVQHISNLPGAGYTNYDGVDNSVVLGATMDNSLQQYPGIYSTDCDEMDIDFVKKKSCVCRSTVDWDASQPVGTVLATIPVTPGFSGAPVGADEQTVTTLGFLSSMFRYWRGGLKFRVAISKTQFHSGRLRISFVPRSTSPSGAGDQRFQCHNWIVDLSESSDISFVVPYVANRPWLEVSVIEADALTNYLNASTGHLVIEVINELRVAGLAKSSVNLSFWLSGADDLEFAVPDFSAYIPYVTPPTPFAELENREFEAQVHQEVSKDVAHQEQEEIPTELMFGSSISKTLDPHGLSIGEKVSSLKQLIKRFGPMWVGFPTPYKIDDGSGYHVTGPFVSNNTSETYSLNSISLDPAYFGELGTDPLAFDRADLPISVDTTTLTPTLGSCNVGRKLSPACPLHYISYLYRFYRGGRRYKIWSLPNRHSKVSAASWSTPNSTATPNVFPDNTQALTTHEFENVRSQLPYVVTRNRGISVNGPVEPPQLAQGYKPTQQAVFETFQYPDLNGCVEVEIPYYSSLPISLVGEGDVGGAGSGHFIERSKVNFTLGSVLEDLETPYPVVISEAADMTNTNACTRNSIGSCRVYTAAADDFSFGYLVGAPKIKRSVS
jgi:hypothetical protein